jgi:hypothetical protein
VQEACQKFFADLLEAAALLGQQRPHQRHIEAVPNGEQQQDVDSLVAQLSVGAI